MKTIVVQAGSDGDVSSLAAGVMERRGLPILSSPTSRASRHCGICRGKVSM